MVFPIEDICPGCQSDISGAFPSEEFQKDQKRSEMTSKIVETKKLKQQGRKDTIIGFVSFTTGAGLTLYLSTISAYLTLLMGYGVYKLVSGLPYALLNVKEFENDIKSKY